MPATLRVAIELSPGAIVPPAATVVAPTVPMPASVPPLLTVVREDVAIEPLTTSVPALTVVAPVKLLTPDSVSMPVPTLTKPPPPLTMLLPLEITSSEMTPETSVPRLFEPTVSVLPPRL